MAVKKPKRKNKKASRFISNLKHLLITFVDALRRSFAKIAKIAKSGAKTITTLTVLIGFVVVMWGFTNGTSSFRDTYSKTFKTETYYEKLIEGIHAGQSTDFISSQLGTPQYTISSKNVTENIYVQKHRYVVRTFEVGGTAVAITVYSLSNDFNPRVPFVANSNIHLRENTLGDLSSNRSSNSSLDGYLLEEYAQSFVAAKSDYGFGVNDFHEVHATYFSMAAPRLDDQGPIPSFDISSVPAKKLGGGIVEQDQAELDANIRSGTTFCDSTYLFPSESRSSDSKKAQKWLDSFVINSYTELMAYHDVEKLCGESGDLVIPHRYYWFLLYDN